MGSIHVLIRSVLISCLAVVASVAVSVPQTALAQSAASGAYLAGRQAAAANDFDAAAQYFVQALARDRRNAGLMEDAIVAFLALGEVKRALPIAQLVEEEGLRSQAAHMVVIADLLEREDYQGFLDRDVDALGIGPLVDSLLTAWAEIGAGDVEVGLATFDAISQESGLRNFALYHKSMAHAQMGDFEAAMTVMDGDGGTEVLLTRRGAMARAEILSQLGRNDEALASLRDAFGTASDPELTVMLNALESNETLDFTHVRGVRDGLAEVFYSLAGALRNEAGPEYTLLYGRVARHLRPDHVDALLLNAELLEDLGQYDLSIEVLKDVPPAHPAFHAAELGRAAALRESGKPDAAIEVLEQLAKRFPDLAVVHSTLGDVLRQQDLHEDAVPSYDRALELTQEGARSLWFLHYARAISHERQGTWDKAEADFRKALELNPGQPQVLNYLGYSLVEKQIKLEEALDMIERAVNASPESGYIVDSLGWVLYRLGRYEEAVVHMERAVELMAIDPVVNDHLGDVYWAVGRFREAEFQWRRALSFVDEDTTGEADPVRMRRKLEVGLDQVLSEEGAPPLKVAAD